jgi:virulence-associated protein VapD
MFNGLMKKAAPPTTSLTPAYRRLQRQLGHIGYLSQGSVFERSPSQQGSRYVWTRKVQAKTVTVALSKEQYQWLRRAVTNQRKLQQLIHQMQKCSHQRLFETLPGPNRRKSLSKKVLGLI